MNKIIILVILCAFYSLSLSAKETHLECIDKQNKEEIYIKFEESFFSAFDYCYSDTKRNVSPEDNYGHEIYELDNDTLWMHVREDSKTVVVDVYDYTSIMKSRIGTKVSIEVTAGSSKGTVWCEVISKAKAEYKSPCAN